MAASFPEIDFDTFHRERLPALLAEGNGAVAAVGASGLGSLAFRLPSGEAFTYVPAADRIDLVEGDAAADTVIELEPDIFSNLVNELDAAAGLLYGGRASCPKGKAIRWLDWEPALRAMYSGRPIYDAASVELLDRHGAPLDVERTFTLADDREDLAHFLRCAGYLLVRNVFRREEIDAFLEEAAALADEAVKGDKLSWWGKNAEGEEILCRVTRAAAKPHLRSFPRDPRMLALKDLSDEALDPRAAADSDQGVSIIWKNPNMTEGLGDIPWHRDCGMGGHAISCPVLIASVFLTPANAETGELKFLPGSWSRGCASIDPNHSRAPQGARFSAQAGDVALHYGDSMHAAPPPARHDLDVYRISAVTAYVKPNTRPHRGKHYNEVLHQRDDGQIEHLTKVAEKL
jgi:hypothetical protein